jgi:hypothetical protein
MIHAERLAHSTLAELEREMGLVQGKIDEHKLYFSRLAAAVAELGCWDDGTDTAINHISFSCHVSRNDAADAIAVGQQLCAIPESIQAMRTGEIGFAHLPVMARTAKAVGDAFDERVLLKKARKCSAGKFYYKAQQYRHSVQPKAYAEEQAEQTQRNRLSMSTAKDGCFFFEAVLDPVSGAAVRSALEPLARPSGEHDERERDQRMADALVEIVTHGGKHNVQLQVTSSIETLLGLVGAQGAEMEFSLPVSSKTVERWACDCSVTRVLMQDSVVIDVGRAKRVISGPTKRALRARDGHCVWPGCDRPASWSAGHHLVHWIHGGTSDLPNLVLLCHRHHRMVHEDNWQIAKTGDGQIMTIAPMVTFGLPRGPD